MMTVRKECGCEMALTLPGPQVPFTAGSAGPAAVVPTAAPLAPPLDFAFCGVQPRSYRRRLGCILPKISLPPLHSSQDGGGVVVGRAGGLGGGGADG